MWKSFITILCASATVLANHQPQSVEAPTPVQNRTRNNRPGRNFVCPTGFVRMRKNCYYFSSSVANWQEAHFHCKDRNATLATLTKKKMNGELRKYLRSPRLKQLERWIGARYNWNKMVWEWGTTGETIAYNAFSKLRSGTNQLYQWHCAVMNPERQFRWAARSCIENKHFICQASAVKLGKPGGKRKPQRRSNLTKNGNRKLIDENAIVPYTRSKWRTTRRSQTTWGNGMNPGMWSPPSKTRWAPGAHYSDRLQLVKAKGSVEPDQYVSAKNVALISPPNSLTDPDKKQYSEHSAGGSRAVPKTLVAAGTENMSNQLGDQLSNSFIEEISLTN